MTDYIYTGSISDYDIHRIRKVLKKNHYRRQYRAAGVYRPREGRYQLDSNRVSQKATFHNQDLKNIIRDYLPEEVIIPDDNHIDLTYYKTGHYFREHKDFVNKFLNNAIQVTIIVGLLTTKSGGTSIRSNNNLTVYNESISKGGLLIFNSRLPHAGETVIGVKEILVFTGYLFGYSLPSKMEPLLYSDYYKCIAVYSYTVYNDYNGYPGSDDELYDTNQGNGLYASPVFYIYHDNKLISISYHHRYDLNSVSETNTYLIKPDKRKEVSDFNVEELSLLNNNPYLPHVIGNNNKFLHKILSRKALLNIFDNLLPNKSQYQHKCEFEYEYEEEFCNGWEEGGGGGGGGSYPVVTEEYTKFTCSKRFYITMYNKNYYRYWLNQISSLPESIFNHISDYLIL